jgi:signal transduction histidine kinase
MLRLNKDQKYLKKIFLVNAISFFIFLAVIALNASVIIINPGVKPFEATYSVVFMHVISGFLMIALTFGFLTAVNVRLNTDIENQVKSNTKFLSIIAHDLRGPLGNITNFLDLLQNETGLSDKERKEYIKTGNYSRRC